MWKVTLGKGNGDRGADSETEGGGGMIFLRLVVECERKNSVKNGCSYFGLNNWKVGLSATDMEKSTGRRFLGKKKISSVLRCFQTVQAEMSWGLEVILDLI